MEQFAEALTEWHPQFNDCWYGVPTGGSVDPAVYKAGAHPQGVEGGELGYLGHRIAIEGGGHVDVCAGCPRPGVDVGRLAYPVGGSFHRSNQIPRWWVAGC